MRTASLLLLVVLLLFAGPAAAAPGEINYEAFPERLLLRMETSSPYMGELEKLTKLPEFSLYGDGTVIFTRADRDDLVELMRAKLEPSETAQLLEFAKSEGLLEWDDVIEKCPLENMPVTVFTLRSLSENRTIRVYGLAYSAGAGLLPPGIARLYARLGSFSHPTTQPFKAEKMKLFVRTVTGKIHKSSARVEVWRPDIMLTKVTGATPSAAFREKVYEGRFAAKIAKFLDGKVLYTRKVVNLFFSQKREVYEVGCRPVLPEE